MLGKLYRCSYQSRKKTFHFIAWKFEKNHYCLVVVYLSRVRDFYTQSVNSLSDSDTKRSYPWFCQILPPQDKTLLFLPVYFKYPLSYFIVILRSYSYHYE